MHRTRTLAFVAALLILSLTLMGCGLITASVRLLSDPTPTRLPQSQTLPLATRTPLPQTLPQVQVQPTLGPIPGQEQGAAQPGQEQQPVAVPAVADADSQVFTAVFKKVSPSVVRIDNLTRISTNSQRADPTSETLPESQGSGWVWDTSGYVVTNNHVVEGADALNVTFADGIELPAELVGTDPDSDLAVIRIDPSHVQLVPTERGRLEDVVVGQRAIAIGNPFGYDNSITTGIVSALGRSIELGPGRYSIPLAIQTDAAINPGNSGGPLLNDRGQVIGVNFLISSPVRSSSGVGFAIPINIVERVVPALIEQGEYKHAWLGVSGRTYSPAWAEALGFPADARGAYVMSVRADGPSRRAGLQGGSQNTNIPLAAGMGSVLYLQRGGDLIIGIDDQPVTTFDDILVYLESYKSPEDEVQLRIMRPGQGERVLTVTLGERPRLTE